MALPILTNSLLLFIPASVPSLLPYALFVAAAVGHTVLLVASHNWWYGYLRSRHLGDLAQLFHGLLVLTGPILFWAYFGFDVPAIVQASSKGGWQAVLGLYVVLCLVLTVCVLPAVTLQRWRRRRPSVLLSNHTKTVDVASELGWLPLGKGSFRSLAYLPGNEVFQVDFAERRIQSPRLPKNWEGLSILHLSDLHLCGTPDRSFFQFVTDRCGEWSPDIVAITGDLVDTDWHYRWLVPVLGRLRWRIAAFAILGNHDSYYDPPLLRRRLRKLGMQVLGNTWTQIEVRGEPLIVIGHEGPWFEPEPDLTKCPTSPFRLCLSHTPDNIRWARRQNVDLMLSGHNHGGQVRLPLIGSVVVPSRYGRRYDCGTFEESPTLLHVSRGLSGQQPLRYNCRPEVTKIVLVSGD